MKKPKITPRENKSGSNSYCVDCGINPVTKKRDRRFFTTKKEAEDYADKFQKEQKQVGELAYHLTTAQRLEAIEAFRKLEAVGATLTEAVDKFILHHKPKNGVKTLKEVVDELLAKKTKSKKKPRYLRDLRFKYAPLLESMGNTFIHDVSFPSVEALLDQKGLSSITYNNYLRDWGMLFSFAQKSGYCAESIMTHVERQSELDKPPRFLSPGDAQTLLLCASKAPRGKDRQRKSERESLVPYIAIGLFAGLRSSELEQLDWADVQLGVGRIRVKAEVSKTSSQRNVTISDNLSAWLKPYQKYSGPIVTTGWRDRLQKIVKHAELVDEEVTPSIKTTECGKGFSTSESSDGLKFKLPKNALRHSFASYHYEFHADAGLTAKELGHESNKMLFKHYRDLVTKEDALLFWNTFPPVNGIAVFETPKEKVEKRVKFNFDFKAA